VCIRNGLSANPLSSSNASTGKDLVSKASIGIGKKTRVITTACRLVDYKGVFRFLRAAKISRASEAVFLLGGHGKLRASAERFISENGLIQKVKLLGYVANMDRLYAISDVIVLSSDAEAQPYLLLEAMRAKRAIVATAVIGNKELISHGNTGYLAEPAPASIAMAIDELLADREKRDEFAERAYVYFCKYHQLERQISELTTIYESSVNNGQWHGAAKLGSK
jgi:glycosyltransferase involved in cell wall biosynthesis